MQETRVRSQGQEDLLKKGMATHSSVFAWRSLWTEEPGGLQSKEFQRVGHDWAANIFTSLSSREVVEWKCWIMKSGFSPQFCASLGKSHHFFSTLPYLCGHLLSPGYLQLLPGPAQPPLASGVCAHLHCFSAGSYRWAGHSAQGYSWHNFKCKSCFYVNTELSCNLFTISVKPGTEHIHSIQSEAGSLQSSLPELDSFTPHMKRLEPKRLSRWATSSMPCGPQNATIMWNSKGHPPMMSIYQRSGTVLAFKNFGEEVKPLTS